MTSTVQPQPYSLPQMVLHFMTPPSEYLTLKRSTKEQIAKLSADLEAAWLESNKTPPPANRRPAKASDIVLGNIIWYDVGPDDYYPTEWAWCEVEKVLCPSSDWKAFETNGTRRGLCGGFVENELAHGTAGGGNQPQTH